MRLMEETRVLGFYPDLYSEQPSVGATGSLVMTAPARTSAKGPTVALACAGQSSEGVALAPRSRRLVIPR